MRVKVLVRTGLLNAAPHALVGYGDEPSHSRPPHTCETDPDCGPASQWEERDDIISASRHNGKRKTT